jgi:Uma2 family endonuclease
MSEAETAPPLGQETPRLPTEDELPYDDGMPMESDQHVKQMTLLIETLSLHWADRDDTFVSGNMFVYFSPDQQRTHDFRGPDFFAVQEVARRGRKSWLVWQEGKPPDVVIELLSPSTAAFDKGPKKRIYQDLLQVPEYFWYDPYSAEWAGFYLDRGRYRPIGPDAQGRLVSRQLGLALVRWEGEHLGIRARWLRFETLDGRLLTTGTESAAAAQVAVEQAARRAEAERLRAEVQSQRAEAESRRAEAESRRAERLAARLRALGEEPDE